MSNIFRGERTAPSHTVQPPSASGFQYQVQDGDAPSSPANKESQFLDTCKPRMKQTASVSPRCLLSEYSASSMLHNEALMPFKPVHQNCTQKYNIKKEKKETKTTQRADHLKTCKDNFFLLYYLPGISAAS